MQNQLPKGTMVSENLEIENIEGSIAFNLHFASSKSKLSN